MELVVPSILHALCDNIIGKCVFREDWKAKEANEYEASDVKKYVDKWFNELKERTQRSVKSEE